MNQMINVESLYPKFMITTNNPYMDSNYFVAARGNGKSLKQLEAMLDRFDSSMIELPLDDVRAYCEADIKATKELINRFYGRKQFNMIPEIEKVIFNAPATIVFWKDGTKTVVQARGDDEFDPEKGLAMAISKKALGNEHDYYEVFSKHVGKYEKQLKKAEKQYGLPSTDEIAESMRKLSENLKKVTGDVFGRGI